MQELEKILEEINDRFENLTIADDECRKTALAKQPMLRMLSRKPEKRLQSC